MSRLSRCVAYGAVLSAGVGLGAAWQAGTATSVEANGLALSREESERLYHELEAGEGALLESSRLMAKIARLTTPSVVHIQSIHRAATGRGNVEETGSGVLMTSERRPGIYVITNCHVVSSAEADAITVQLHDGRELRPEQIWMDKATDIAVIKIAAPDLQAARWGDSDQLEIGHWVLAMGSPFGLSQSVTLGIVSAKGRRALKLGPDSAVLNQDFLQTDAAINPGNSGGPLIDMHGRVVGINTAIASNSGGNDGIGFSVPSNLVRSIAEQLIANGRVQRAYLGVKLDPRFDADAARRFDLDRRYGARVLEVYPNTPASAANLQFNDVILSFDGIDVQDENHLINLVSLRPVGQRVRLVVLRGGRRITLTVLLADRTKAEQQSATPPSRPGTGIPVQPMGLTLQQVDGSMAAQIGFEATAEGLLVLRVDPAGPLAGQVELYDLIEEVARRPVHSVAELQAALRSRPDDPALLLKIRRRTAGQTTDHVILWQR